jgi:hypothetical protein
VATPLPHPPFRFANPPDTGRFIRLQPLSKHFRVAWLAGVVATVVAGFSSGSFQAVAEEIATGAPACG